MCSPTAFAGAGKSFGLLEISKLLNAAEEILETSHPSCLCLMHGQARKQLHYFQGVISVQSADSYLPPDSHDLKCRLLQLHITLFPPIFLCQAFCFKAQVFIKSCKLNVKCQLAEPSLAVS